MDTSVIQGADLWLAVLCGLGLLLVGVGVYGLLRGPASRTDTDPAGPSVSSATSPPAGPNGQGPVAVPQAGGPEAFARAVAVALFPPLALAITLELVALIAYRSRRDAEPYPAPVDDLDRTVTVVDGEDAPRDWWQDAPVVEARHEPAPEPVAVEHDQADDETDDETDDEGADPRVRDLARRLAAGEALTGAEVGQRYAVSARTGRRLIRQATEQGPTLALVSAGGES